MHCLHWFQVVIGTTSESFHLVIKHPIQPMDVSARELLSRDALGCISPPWGSLHPEQHPVSAGLETKWLSDAMYTAVKADEFWENCVQELVFP